MASKGVATAKLNVSLLKPTVKQFKDALKDDHTLTNVPLKAKIGQSSALFVKAPHNNPPSWQRFLAPIASQPLQLANASSSAVMFVKNGGRIFAFSFGHGKSELRPEIFENGFGLKVALNRIDPNRLRSVDARTIENGVTTKRLQTSRDADQTAFGLDVARDLLRQVVGQPDDLTFAKKLVGSDSLTLHAEVTASGLGAKCDQLLAAFQETKYKTHFDWVDHLAEVRDPGLRAQLDDLLVAHFKSGQFDNLHLAATSVVDWENVERFKINGAGKTVFHDLDLEDYASALGTANIGGMSLDKLKTYKIQAQFTGTEGFFPQASVYSSLVWETSHNNILYALVDGQWYSVDAGYAKRVKDYVSNIPAPLTNLLPDSQASEKEGAFNSRVATLGGEFFLFDQRCVRPDGGATDIEFCDLFSKAKQLFHVKRKTRSATLSHLFAQGTVSAQLFIHDAKMRKQLKEVIRKHAPNGGFLQHIPDTRPNAGDYEVVYAIVAKSNKGWPLSLPFFSQVNLVYACKQLDALGFRFALQRVNET